MAKRPTKQAAARRVTFKLSAPEAKTVLVTGSFCNWQIDAHSLKKDKAGTWSKLLLLAPGTYEYRFVVDGEWRNDPACAERVPNAHGTENCLLRVLAKETTAKRAKPAAKK